MKTLKNPLNLLAAFLLFSFQSKAQGTEGVSIKTSPSAPHISAMLEVQSDTKGVLIPRVTLTSTASASPVTTPAEGLLVYNSAGSLTHGFYYWTGSQWAMLSSSGDLWSPDPNSGIFRNGVTSIGNPTVGAPASGPGAGIMSNTLQVYAPVVLYAQDKKPSSPANYGLHIGENNVPSPSDPFYGGHWQEINCYTDQIQLQYNTGQDVDIGAYKGANLYVDKGSSKPGNIYAGGMVFAAGNPLTSDSTLKKNFSLCTGVLSNLNSFSTYFYNFKTESNDDQKHIGVIAQEVQKTYPQLVQTSSTYEVTKKGTPDQTTTTTTHLAVEYSGLTALLLQAIKEQQAQIDALTARVHALDHK